MADRWAEEFNGASDDDEALRIAIAMSLGEEPPAKKKKKPLTVDLTQDDGDEDEIDLTREEDIETASESSSGSPRPGMIGADSVGPEVKTVPKGEVGERKQESKNGNEGKAEPVPASETSGASSLSALLGLDRAKMEEERLARLRKRKAAEEGHSQADSSKRVKTNDENRRPDAVVGASKQPAAQRHAGVTQMPARPAQPKIATLASLAEQRQTHHPPKIATKSGQSSGTYLPYPKGVVKKTWCRGQPRLGDDITIGEVLQKDECELALISSFQWDQEWMYEQFDLKRTKLILVSQGGSDEEVRGYCICYR